MHTKRSFFVLLAVTLIIIGQVACTSTPIPQPTTSVKLTPTVTNTPIPEPSEGITITVTSVDDSGPGTLRQALWDAQAGVTIIFDPAVFPPDNPNTIFLTSNLPTLRTGNLTLDASNAGVILDGSNIKGKTAMGLIIGSSGNTIQGLQIINFLEIGIGLEESASENVIGGDRNIGNGPLGQGNLISGNGLRGIDSIGASFNHIAGNFIGTDVSGQNPFGNEGDGIWIDGGIENVIGPNNIIAFNGTSGITIRNPDTLKNTITQNSIYDNGVDGVTGIFLSVGGNSELLRPVILDFDLEEGIARGITCAKCIVELFSDESRQGRIFEGRVTATDAGTFAFDAGQPFTGPHLTAITTDLEGNSSAFSRRTYGIRASIILQEENDSTVTRFQPQPAAELEDNRIGEMTTLHENVVSEEAAWVLSHFHNSLGLKWYRMSIDMFDWNEVEDTGLFSKYTITSLQDRFIREVYEDGFTILYTIVYWDDAIQTNGNYSRFQTEEEIQRYLEYIHFIVDHFKGYIQYYALLNEPNIGLGTQQYVESSDYINMVRSAIPVIRQADPDVKIIIGEVTPLYEQSAWDYFTDILRSDVISLVDGVSWHPGSASPEYREEYYYALPAQVEEITQIALANSFDGEFIASELHFRSAINPHPHEYSEYDLTAAVKYTIRNIVMFLGMEDFITGLALENDTYSPMVINWIQNVSTVMADATPAELTVEIESEVALIANYNFILSNGDRLVAIWSDGVAFEYDPGLNSTVVINGLPAEKVVGIDVLNGIEQELIFSIEDGKLIIRDLLIRDYPIILRLH